MRPIAKIAAVIYVLAAAAVIGLAVAQLDTDLSRRAAILLLQLPVRISLMVCGAIVGIHALYMLLRVCFDHPEPAAIRLAEAPEIEVSLAALEGVSRLAAEDESGILVDRVLVSVRGRARDRVCVRLDAISLVGSNLAAQGKRMEERVTKAVARMLGTSVAEVHVRFLPTKTTIQTKEVSGA
ncbi:hypothetical protein K6V98_07585 [Collinsella sp. AGMB00827]|uniref:Alkaline shock response membrane anchor protein AmaP n=1 Tax=Collinsella ureilytica TaxID=2869515 RepID=A0ABS7MM77_9ACTN|nr:hypothetical protein [Collinsella urealyticum]MBY4798205.1 hypothetical protein [Collinsella urealyticum]